MLHTSQRCVFHSLLIYVLYPDMFKLVKFKELHVKKVICFLQTHLAMHTEVMLIF